MTTSSTTMPNETDFEVLPPEMPGASYTSRDLTPDQELILKQVEKLARILDSALNIPGLNWRVGADGIIGMLLPVVGDVATSLASGFIVIQAGRLGLPRAKLAKMVMNILVDTGVGSVPFAGDIFDLVVKANLKNVDMIRAHFQLPPMERSWKTPPKGGDQ
jgi:ABC-type lipopolysaccharide export system ATPase subunit